MSRYENGWTRFETYTLQKLATALGGELHLELRPRSAARQLRISRDDVVRQLSRLFWDHPLTEADLSSYPVWVLERVLDYGSLQDIRVLQEAMGRMAFLQTASRATRVSPRTLNFWSQILKR